MTEKEELFDKQFAAQSTAQFAEQSTAQSAAQSTAQSTAQSIEQSTAQSPDIQKNMYELYTKAIKFMSCLLNDLKTPEFQKIIDKIKYVLEFYEKLGPEKKFTYAMASFLLMMIFGILTDILFSVSYIAYPIYATMKTIKIISEKSEKTAKETTKDANIKILIIWSIYWIVYSLFNFVELYLPLYNHIPYYKYIKLFVLVFGFMDLTEKYNNYSLKLTDHAIKLYERHNDVFDGIASKFGIIELKDKNYLISNI